MRIQVSSLAEVCRSRGGERRTTRERILLMTPDPTMPSRKVPAVHVFASIYRLAMRFYFDDGGDGAGAA